MEQDIEIINKDDIKFQVVVNKINNPETPLLWTFQQLVYFTNIGRKVWQEYIANGKLIRDEHYFMKGSHYLFDRDKIMPFIKGELRGE